MDKKKLSIALVDDHILVRNGLANIIQDMSESYVVLFEANNGADFIKQLQPEYLPDIVLLDVNMPQMDGYETALWLKHNYPGIKILALSMYDDENSIIKMIKNGAKGYILKDIYPHEFRQALDSVVCKGFYYSELMTGKLLHAINQLEDSRQTIDSLISLKEREIYFLKLACTEMTYKEIAEKMSLSARTIDSIRIELFEKLSVKSRVGLVLYAIRNEIADIGNE